MSNRNCADVFADNLDSRLRIYNLEVAAFAQILAITQIDGIGRLAGLFRPRQVIVGLVNDVICCLVPGLLRVI